MRGKQPKEREHYVLRMADGTLVDVTREVYLEWYRSQRRERYQKERSRKHGICSLDDLEGREKYSGHFRDVAEGLEEIVLRNICQDKVREVLQSLSAEDARLIELLYFAEVTVTDTAKIFGCSRKTIQNRRKRILQELCRKMKEQGIQGGYY